MSIYDEKMNRSFVTLPSFLAKWQAIGLTDEDMRRLEQELLVNPKVGSVMRGTGRARKMRFAFENRGKSGSARVIYIDFEVYELIYFVDVYAKDKKANLSKGEQNDMKQLVDLIELAIERDVRR